MKNLTPATQFAEMPNSIQKDLRNLTPATQFTGTPDWWAFAFQRQGLSTLIAEQFFGEDDCKNP